MHGERGQRHLGRRTGHRTFRHGSQGAVAPSRAGREADGPRVARGQGRAVAASCSKRLGQAGEEQRRGRRDGREKEKAERACDLEKRKTADGSAGACVCEVRGDCAVELRRCRRGAKEMGGEEETAVYKKGNARGDTFALTFSITHTCTHTHAHAQSETAHTDICTHTYTHTHTHRAVLSSSHPLLTSLLRLHLSHSLRFALIVHVELFYRRSRTLLATPILHLLSSPPLPIISSPLPTHSPTHSPIVTHHSRSRSHPDLHPPLRISSPLPSHTHPPSLTPAPSSSSHTTTVATDRLSPSHCHHHHHHLACLPLPTRPSR